MFYCAWPDTDEIKLMSTEKVIHRRKADDQLRIEKEALWSTFSPIALLIQALLIAFFSLLYFNSGSFYVLISISVCFISTFKAKNEPFPTNYHEPELPIIYPQSGTSYDFSMETISTCIICTVTVV